MGKVSSSLHTGEDLVGPYLPASQQRRSTLLVIVLEAKDLCVQGFGRRFGWGTAYSSFFFLVGTGQQHARAWSRRGRPLPLCIHSPRPLRRVRPPVILLNVGGQVDGHADGVVDPLLDGDPASAPWKPSPHHWKWPCDRERRLTSSSTSWSSEYFFTSSGIHSHLPFSQVRKLWWKHVVLFPAVPHLIDKSNVGLLVIGIHLAAALICWQEYTGSMPGGGLGHEAGGAGGCNGEQGDIPAAMLFRISSTKLRILLPQAVAMKGILPLLLQNRIRSKGPRSLAR
jgi:hypothetical protein